MSSRRKGASSCARLPPLRASRMQKPSRCYVVITRLITHVLQVAAHALEAATLSARGCNLVTRSASCYLVITPVTLLRDRLPSD